MIDTLQVYHELQQTMDTAAAEKIAQVIGRVYTELRQTVTKVEFGELKTVVAELAEAQKDTAQRMGELAAAQQRTEQRMEELAAAQQRTEQRVDTLGQRMEELSAAQARTEQTMGALSHRMDELTAAQARTEQTMEALGHRMDELAAAEQRTEQRMDELTAAQARAEQEIALLVHEQRLMRGDLGGLARSFGYALENEAYRMLPGWLKRKYDIQITRRFVRLEMGNEEINLFAHARRNGHKVLLVGETKSRLDERREERKGQKDVFQQLANKIRVVRATYPKTEIVPVIVTHFAKPKMLEKAQAQGIIVAQSFEW